MSGPSDSDFASYFLKDSRPPGGPLALGERARSWGDLLAGARQIGDWVGKSSRPTVVLASGDPFHVAVALLGTWISGGRVVLPPNLRPDTVRALAEQVGATAVLSDSQGVGTELGGLLDTVPPERKTEGKTEQKTPEIAFTLPAGHTGLTIYTSGSTGEPTPCHKTLRQVLGEAAFLARFFDLRDQARIACTAPPHHLYGLLFGVLVPMLGGGAFVRALSPFPTDLAGAIATEQANVVCSVPAHLAGFRALATTDLPGVRQVFSSGGRLDERTALDLARFDFAIIEVFGSTESGGIACRAPARSLDWRPFDDVRVSADEAGCLLVESPFVPEDAKVHRCADRVEVHADGSFRHLGRHDEVVKIGGERVSISEVEQTLRRVAGVVDAAVLKVATAGPRQWELWAAVVAPDLNAGALRSRLLALLDPVAIPRRFHFSAALPREQSGKVVRDRLLALFDTTSIDGGGPSGTRGGLAS